MRSLRAGFPSPPGRTRRTPPTPAARTEKAGVPKFTWMSTYLAEGGEERDDSPAALAPLRPEVIRPLPVAASALGGQAADRGQRSPAPPPSPADSEHSESRLVIDEARPETDDEARSPRRRRALPALLPIGQFGQ